MAGIRHGGVYISANGDVNISGSAVGAGATVSPYTQESEQPSGRDWDIGVITVLSEEAHAVRDMMRSAGRYQTQDQPGGLRFDEAVIRAADGQIKIAGLQSLDPGVQPAGHAFDDLTKYYAPTVVVLAGIAGGIHPSVRLGDVILTREVIYYDQRKETPAAVLRRGTSYRVPHMIVRAINNLLSDHGEPCILTATGPDRIRRKFRVLFGPIGSGEVVVARADSEVTDYLRRWNDKTLAIETETAGLARAFYEKGSDRSRVRGWLAVRGISDLADQDKNDDWHGIASVHAAATLQVLAPYLKRACGR
jgi:adenosylhomocysteine nucleosidase